MSVKFSRYVFRRVRGRIIPIRKELDRATKSQNKLVDGISKMVNQTKKEAKKHGLDKLGAGVDFSTFKRSSASDFVLKILKERGGKVTRGTTNKTISKKYPKLEDRIAVNKALGDNLPNFGVPTKESEIVRISKDKRAILQEYLSKKKIGSNKNNWAKRTADQIKRDHGLDIDMHYGNITKSGTLFDTGGNLARSKNLDETAKELLGIDNYYGTNIDDVYKRSTVMSDEALLKGQSKKALRRINKMFKKGYRFKKVGSNEYKLVKKFDKK